MYNLKEKLKWYYDNKTHFYSFFSDFETMFTKHFPSEILNLNFEKTVINCNFTI